MIPKSKLKKLQRDLKGQSLEELAKKLDKSKAHLYDVLAGRTDNEETLSYLIDFRNEVKARIKELTDRI